jgi:hypothetical protein
MKIEIFTPVFLIPSAKSSRVPNDKMSFFEVLIGDLLIEGSKKLKVVL